jgi:hypothetical protein
MSPKRRKPEEQRHCELPGCDRLYYGRGLCHMHYDRAKGRGLEPEQALATWTERDAPSLRLARR